MVCLRHLYARFFTSFVIGQSLEYVLFLFSDELGYCHAERSIPKEKSATTGRVGKIARAISAVSWQESCMFLV